MLEVYSSIISDSSSLIILLTMGCLGGGGSSYSAGSGTSMISGANVGHGYLILTYNVSSSLEGMTGSPTLRTPTTVPTNAILETISYTFIYTGAVQVLTIPPLYYSMIVQAYGSAGAFGSPAAGAPGFGGFISSHFSVTPGDVYYVYVGR